MSVVELLLKLDAQKLKAPTKEIEIVRLTELLGEKFIITIQGISQEKTNQIRDMATKLNLQTREYEVDIPELKLAVVLNGVINPNLKDESLLKHFNAPTPYELIKTLFSPGEFDAIYDRIQELNGYGDNVIEEIKN